MFTVIAIYFRFSSRNLRSALQNAASAAGMILTSEAIVSELPEKEEKGGGMPGGMPGGMGGGMGMGGMDY